jgi:magnesium chelatase family protein
MLARVYSCAVIGLEGVIVEVEVDTSDGLPGMAIVGSKSLNLLVVIG